MADETPTLRLVFDNAGAVFTHGHLANTPSGAPYPIALAHDDWAALAAALRQPRCGERMDSVLDDSLPLVCDLSYGHPGKWHGADQFPPEGGLPSRCEWTHDDQGWLGRLTVDEPDPRTTEVLFEQRDTAIEERERLRGEVERLTALLADRQGKVERMAEPCPVCGKPVTGFEGELTDGILDDNNAVKYLSLWRIFAPCGCSIKLDLSREDT